MQLVVSRSEVVGNRGKVGAELVYIGLVGFACDGLVEGLLGLLLLAFELADLLLELLAELLVGTGGCFVGSVDETLEAVGLGLDLAGVSLLVDELVEVVDGSGELVHVDLVAYDAAEAVDFRLQLFYDFVDGSSHVVARDTYDAVDLVDLVLKTCDVGIIVVGATYEYRSCRGSQCAKHCDSNESLVHNE